MKRIIISLVAMAAFVSCAESSEGLADITPATDEICNITVSTSLASEGNVVVSKADDTPTDDGLEDFVDGSTVGLAVYRTGDNPVVHSYPNVVNNFKATHDTSDGDRWSYSFRSDYWVDALPQVSLKVADGNFKVYGYYPFNSSVTDITKVPFDLTKIQLYMYGSSGDIIMPNSGLVETPIDVKLKQAMTRLLFKVQLQNPQASVEWRCVKFVSESESIIKSGYYNALTGAISEESTKVNTLETTSFSVGMSATYENSKSIYLAPFELDENNDDDDIKISFRFENVYSKECITLKKGDFAAGVSHTITVTLDNFNKITASKIEIDKVWKDETIDWDPDKEGNNGVEI